MPDAIAPQVVPLPIRWTAAEFFRIKELEIFEGRHIELIEGEWRVVPSVKTPRHCMAVIKTDAALRYAFGEGFVVCSVGLLVLGEDTAPEPDLMVIPGDIRDYWEALPTTALLVVEVAENTLIYDRAQKASLYARAGIADYWLTSLIEDCIEVRRQPKEQKDAPFGHVYDEVRIYRRGETIAPLAKPEAQVAVDDLLPPPQQRLIQRAAARL